MGKNKLDIGNIPNGFGLSAVMFESLQFVQTLHWLFIRACRRERNFTRYFIIWKSISRFATDVYSAQIYLQKRGLLNTICRR